ncbi:3-methyl-2-oxobutanoate hydroxymethyltransferase [Pseudomonas kribbensis]|uniref:3-methyl-2-oxobutanoate hydroxymethyltransferase n=1 Tax=Pseudomonas kribbensis TaxID=1628086 RepID=A0A4Y8VIL3_9PSED|nr:3-methyl-2-oxobutanoate hydroxymethyltransferase [Pseudomonas kribbensis]TFH80283.1 hypothetical protein E4J90_12510 [Pseudomonas kribbensis]
MSDTTSPYGNNQNLHSRVRIPHLQQMKVLGQKWAMLTAYDMYAASIFEEAGIPVLLVGDSASNNVFGHESTLPVTVDELLPLVRAVSRTTRRPLVIADLPFGSYQATPKQCFHTAVGIGAGVGCDAQVLVWQDMAGLRTGHLPRFVKQYADLRGVLLGAARDFADDVQTGRFPGPEHAFPLDRAQDKNHR